VGGVGRVEEGVHSGAVGAGGDRGGAGNGLLLDRSLLELLSLDRSLLELLSLDWSLLELLSLDRGLLELLSLDCLLSRSWSGSELSSVNVGLEVKVRGVGGVDEGVEVAAWNLRLWLRCELLSLDRSDRSRLGGDGCSLRLLRFSSCDLRVKGSALQTIGSLWDVSSLQDPEAVLAGGVPHGDGLAVLVDVAVLADPLPVSSRLLPEHSPVLLGEG